MSRTAWPESKRSTTRVFSADASPEIARTASSLYWAEAWLPLWRYCEALAIVDEFISLGVLSSGGGCILEAGSSDGRFFELLAKVFDSTPGAPKLIGGNVRALGLDSHPRKIFGMGSRRPFIEPVLGNLNAIPLPASSVDVVVCNSTLEHVESPKSVLLELKRVLRPGGVVVLTVPSLLFEPALLGYRVRDFLGFNNAARAWAQRKSKRISHRHYYSRSELENGLRSAGFLPISFRSIVPLDLVALGDLLQWVRDFGVGGGAWSIHQPSSDFRGFVFRVFRNLVVNLETRLISRFADSDSVAAAAVGGGAYIVTAEKSR